MKPQHVSYAFESQSINLSKILISVINSNLRRCAYFPEGLMQQACNLALKIKVNLIF